MKTSIELDKLARSEDATAFIAAVRSGNASQVGTDSFTTSGVGKTDRGQARIGQAPFVASGGGKEG